MSGLFCINKKNKWAPNNKVSRFPPKKHTVLHPPQHQHQISQPCSTAASSCNCCSSTGNIDGESSDAKTSTKASLGSLRGGNKGGINFLEVISCLVPWSQGFLYNHLYRNVISSKRNSEYILSSPESLHNKIDAATLETATLPKHQTHGSYELFSKFTHSNKNHLKIVDKLQFFS